MGKRKNSIMTNFFVKVFVLTALAKNFCLAFDKNDENTTSTIAKSTDASENESDIRTPLDARGRNFGAYSYLVDSAGKRTDNEAPQFWRTSSAATLRSNIVTITIVLIGSSAFCYSI